MLLKIGELLRDLYEKKNFTQIYSLDAEMLNRTLISNEVYSGNSHMQKENFERFIMNIYDEI